MRDGEDDTRLSVSAFLALKVAFAEAILELCRVVGANPEVVVGGMESDHRIGSLRPDVSDLDLPGDLRRLLGLHHDALLRAILAELPSERAERDKRDRPHR